LIGAEYKSMTSEEKKKYDAMAMQDKERYKKEMAKYVPSDEKPKTTKVSPKKAVEKKVADDDDSDSDEDLVVDDSDDDDDSDED
jgi:structure-specific recognition protein 1